MSAPRLEDLLTDYFHRTRETEADHQNLETMARVMVGVDGSRENAAALIASNPELAEALLVVSGEALGVRPPRKLGTLVGLIAIAAAVAAVVLISRPVPEPLSELAPKGTDDRLHVAVQRGDLRFRVRAKDKIAAGDHLGFFYSAHRRGHLALLSMDQAGVVSLLSQQEIDPGSSIALRDGAMADTGVGCEWIVGVFSDGPLEADELRRQIATAPRADGDCSLEPKIPSARAVRVIPVVR